MVNGPKRGRKRRPRKVPKGRRSSSQNSFIMQSLGAVISIVLVIFLETGDIIERPTAVVLCMLILAVMFYLMFAANPKPRRRRRKRSKKSEPKEKEPQFYTALPSTLGLTEIPEMEPTPQVKLPPRPIRAARRRRDFVTYPLAVGGGDYSDSYVQVDKDTVLRLRSEMSPDSQTLKLPGSRISSFPSAKEASIMSQNTESVSLDNNSEVAAVAEPMVAEAAPVAAVAEPMVAEAAPVAAVAEPMVAGAAPVEGVQVASPVVQPIAEEEEEEMEFDMEWD